MNRRAQEVNTAPPVPTRLVAPKVLRVVHSIHRENRSRDDAAAVRIPKELYSQQLSAYERDYLNWYHGDPLKRSLVQAHRRSAGHRTEVLASRCCGCFHCGAQFPPRAITAWVKDANEATAFCPRCDIDAVLGDASGYPITPAFLAEMRERWFGD